MYSFIHSSKIKDGTATFFTFPDAHWPRLPSADCSKTFRVSLGSEPSPKTGQRLHPLFIPIGAVPFQHLATAQCLIRPSAPSSWREPAFRPLLSSLLTRSRVLFLYVGYYVLVYLQGFFLHCVNSRQQEMLCHSLFLSGGQRRLFCCCCCANRVRAVCATHSLHFSFPFRSHNMQISFQRHFPLDSQRPRNEKSYLFIYFLVSSALLHFFLFYFRKFVLKKRKSRNHNH